MKEKVTDALSKKSKLTVAIYVILRLMVIFVLVMSVLHKNFENVFICVLTLFLLILPTIIERKFKIDIPSTLEIVILLFIFAAEILGEINSFYTLIPKWDEILHTTNGFVMGAIGLSLIELLNKSENISMKLSPIFIAIVSFCFSMTIGVCWEFFEYGMDQVFHLDMQKDTIINEIHSVTFDPDGLNNIHSMNIESVKVNDVDFVKNYGGYIDIGLTDTMRDLIVNFYGALVISFFGYFYSKSENKKLRGLMITPAKE